MPPFRSLIKRTFTTNHSSVTIEFKVAQEVEGGGGVVEVHKPHLLLGEPTTFNPSPQIH